MAAYEIPKRQYRLGGRNKGLQIFEAVHGIPRIVMTGVSWDIHRKRISVTIAEDWNDGGSDGWVPEDLHPVLRKAKA